MIICLNILTYLSMMILIVLFCTGNIEPTSGIYLEDKYFLIYRCISKSIVCSYILLVGRRLGIQINMFSGIRPSKFIRSIYVVLFVMIANLLFYMVLIGISIGSDKDNL